MRLSVLFETVTLVLGYEQDKAYYVVHEYIMYQTQKKNLMLFCYLGQHVSTLIESTSGLYKIEIQKMTL